MSTSVSPLLTLEPEDAFGEYDAELVRVEPQDRFPAEVKVGMQFEGYAGQDTDRYPWLAAGNDGEA